MADNQSNESSNVQVGVRISTVLDQHIGEKAKAGFRSKSDELRMLLKKGFADVYGYDPEEVPTERLAA